MDSAAAEYIHHKAGLGSFGVTKETGLIMNNQTTLRTNEAAEEIGHSIVNHYAPKAEITESIILGTTVTALCGLRYVVSGQGGGSTQNRKAVVCPLCGDIYDGLGA